MPRDWRNDPAAIAKHCECTYRPETTYDPHNDKVIRVRLETVAINPDCPLHGDDPKHDLPDGVL